MTEDNPEKMKIGSLMKLITKASKDAEPYHTGLVGENIIVGSYKQMPLDKLEKLRFIINKIIKKKKEAMRYPKLKNESKL